MGMEREALGRSEECGESHYPRRHDEKRDTMIESRRRLIDCLEV